MIIRRRSGEILLDDTFQKRAGTWSQDDPQATTKVVLVGSAGGFDPSVVFEVLLNIHEVSELIKEVLVPNSDHPGWVVL